MEGRKQRAQSCRVAGPVCPALLVLGLSVMKMVEAVFRVAKEKLLLVKSVS